MVNPVTIAEEYKKNADLKEDDLNALRDWCSEQKHLPQITDELLALFLNSSHYNPSRAQIMIDNYFTFRTICPELFDNRDPEQVDIRNGKHVVHLFMLPSVTPNGSRVLFLKSFQTDPSLFSFSEVMKSFVMTADLEHRYHGTSDGFIIAFDMEGIVFGHLLKMNVQTFKRMLYYLQEAMPIRLKGLHFINPVPFMDKILALMKPFMKKQLKDKIHVHSHGFTKFYDSVPQKMLPKDYGGDSPSVEELHDEYFKLRQSSKKWFEEEAKLRVVEALRPGKADAVEEILGDDTSFKNLNLD